MSDEFTDGYKYWWINNKEFTEKVSNLLLNMQGGLLPEHLKEEEIALLEEAFSSYWFEVLGYTEPKYKKPVKE